MKKKIENALFAALAQLQQQQVVDTLPAAIQIESTKDPQHGDFASNIALMLAKQAKRKPRELAELLVAALPQTNEIQKIEIAGPGFINFFIANNALSNIVGQILREKTRFGKSKMGRKKRILVEFLSSNPTGPLHVGHGRHAALGAVIVNLLNAVGFNTYSEYYVNDAGRQMDILAVSVWFRYLSYVEPLTFPSNAYQGEYIVDIAKNLRLQHGDALQKSSKEILMNLPADEPAGGDKEIYIDALIEKAKSLLGKNYQLLLDFSLQGILADIKNDLAEFGVQYDNWFSERDFVASDVIDIMLEKLKKANCVYEKEGALWLASTRFGDEKDRVLIRSNGTRTYFVNDAAYHLNKYERGFDLAVDIFGSDHHGYVPRLKAVLQALSINPERLQTMLVQFVSLYRSGKPAQMSTRGGNFVTLRELRQEVGNDAARYFYVMRKSEMHMDFDLDLAKSQTNDNPVYYVQYAHARICSVFRQLNEKKIKFDEEDGILHLSLLQTEAERQLCNSLGRFPEVMINAALHYEPHLLTNYLRELAGNFHFYYNSCQFIVEETSLRNARLALIKATQQTLQNAFHILGISAPETM